MKLTASKIDLARRCLWPFRPDAGPRNQGTAYAASGHDEHAAIERTLLTGDTTPQSPTHERWLRDWYATAPRDGLMAERPIAMDPRTGETRLGPDGWDRRDYAWAPGYRWMVGTPDLARIGDDGVAYQSPILLSVGGREQVVAVGDTRIFGIDPAAGRLLWEHAHGGEVHPIATESIVPVPAGDGRR
jgi:hypothetical protein